MSRTRAVFLSGAEGRRPLVPEAFPVPVGGPGAPIAPGFGREPSAHLGFSQGDLFVQPRSGASPVLCNGVALTASRWLEDGDRLSVGGVRIDVRVEPAGVELAVAPAEEDNVTQPPRLLPAAARRAGPVEDARIRPVAFEPRPIRGVSRPRRRIGRQAVAGGAVLAALLGPGWFVLTARSVGVETEPAAERVSFRGGLPGLKLGDRHLLRPGRYTLVAERPGYETLEADVEVGDAAHQELRFALEKLPGLLGVESGGVAARVLIDGEPVGSTPLRDLELEPGERELRVEAERYRAHTQRIEIEGGGARQVVRVELEPRWAEVTLSSQPAGAAVRVDGERIGQTPLTAELLAGERRLELSLAGYKPHVERLQVVASRAQTVPEVALQPSDGNLVVTSEPSGAAVSVGGRLRGETPLDLFLAPGAAHALHLIRPGYAPQTLEVEVGSGESRSIEVVLEPRLGQLEVVALPPDAELLVDGEPRGRAGQVLELLAVEHEIELRRPGYESHRTTVAVKPDFPQKVEVELRSLEAPAQALAEEIEGPEGHTLRLMPAGGFRMGASRREPGRRANETLRDVQLARRFYLATAEVTNRQFRRFRKGHLSGRFGEASLETDHHPVVQVSWQDAAAYCNWLSEQASLPPAYEQRDGKLVPVVPLTTGYRLPTEAEWEWAARYAGRPAPLKYPWGSGLPVAPGSGNYADASARGIVPGTLEGYDDGYPGTSPAESFGANAVGLFGLGGNAAEWAHDLYTIHPPGGEVARDPTGPEDGEHHVIRGSSYLHSTVTELRLSFRDYGDGPRPDVGFRVARYAE